jgi:hypothetical protein
VAFHLFRQTLVKVQLADMVRAGIGDGLVGTICGIGGVHNNVDVNGSAAVVAGVGGHELNGANVICPLEPTEEGIVQVLGGGYEVTA